MVNTYVPAGRVRPEVELILCCVRISEDSARAEHIRALLQEQIDWQYLFRIAHEHRVMPLLFWNLNAACPEAIPEAILSQLQDRFHENNLRNLARTRELLGIVREFGTRGIPVIPYKGPILAAEVYGNLGLREFGDLDVLVHQQDITKAREALVSLGYQPQYRLTAAQEAAFLRYEREYTFSHGDKGSVVELHWEVAPKAFPFSLNAACLWSRLERVTLAGHTLTTFSPEDLLLILCVHGADHRWRRLAWIRDVAELLRANPEINWGRIVQEATAQGSDRILFVGVYLASDVLGANLPKKFAGRLGTDPAVRRIARLARKQLFIEGPQGIFDEDSLFQPFHLWVMKRRRDKIRYCLRKATYPVFRDLALLPLPAPLFPMYHLIRPIRLAGKYGRRILGE
jgi:hypothetical protein